MKLGHYINEKIESTIFVNLDSLDKFVKKHTILETEYKNNMTE